MRAIDNPAGGEVRAARRSGLSRRVPCGKRQSRRGHVDHAAAVGVTGAVSDAAAPEGAWNRGASALIAVDEKTSIPLVHTQAETYEIAVSRIESDLHDLDIVE
jgi:hypothetical protein